MTTTTIQPQDFDEHRRVLAVHNARVAEDRAREITRLHRPSIRRTIRNLSRRGYSLVKAIASLAFARRLTNAQYESRVLACLTCEKLMRSPNVPLGHCGACGCARTRIAELTVKGNMPAATCPLKKWAV